MTEPYTIIRRCLFLLISSVRYHWIEILLRSNKFVLPISFHLNILKIAKILQFWNKKLSTCVAQEVKQEFNMKSNEEIEQQQARA